MKNNNVMTIREARKNISASGKTAMVQCNFALNKKKIVQYAGLVQYNSYVNLKTIEKKKRLKIYRKVVIRKRRVRTILLKNSIKYRVTIILGHVER